MNKLSSGSEFLDRFLEGGYEKGSLTTIYGPAASGKTLLCLISAIKTTKTKKVIYIDTTKGFSASRINQLNNPENALDNMFLLKPKNFYEQKIMIENLKENINKDIGLIIIDTLTYFYRLELAKDVDMINKVLASQLNCLKEIAMKNDIPIIITNQIYDDLKTKDNVKMIGGQILKIRSNCIMELKNYKAFKKVIMKKPANEKELLFKIEEKGISEFIPR